MNRGVSVKNWVRLLLFWFAAMVSGFGVVLVAASLASAMAADSALAAAPDFRIETRTEGKWLRVSAFPPPAHHINVKAPAYLEAETGGARIQPEKIRETGAEFRMPLSRPGVYRVTLYLCDDGNTYCEKRQVKLNREGEHGFILNDPEQALKLAKSEGKPLMIDFFAIWCPPCNVLDASVFSSSEFKESGLRFVRLKLDADTPISWPLKAKYRVSGYPTVVFSTPEGDEIGRVVGSRTKADFLAEMEKAWQSRVASESALEKRAKGGDRSAAAKLARILLDRSEYGPSLRYFEIAGEKSEAYHEARIGALSETLAEASAEASAEVPGAKQIEALEAAIAAFPDTAESVSWRQQLAEAHEKAGRPEKHAEVLKETIRIAGKLAKTPSSLAGKEMTRADLLVVLAESYEGLKQEAKAKEYWKKSADEYASRIKSPKDRGNQLELAYGLWKSGDFASADALYSRLEKDYPGEFTFYYYHGAMKRAQKKLDDARVLLAKALERSYGDNRLRSALLMAKILKDLGRGGDAKSVVQKTLAEVPLPADKTIRTHRLAGSLRDFLKELGAGNSG